MNCSLLRQSRRRPLLPPLSQNSSGVGDESDIPHRRVSIDHSPVQKAEIEITPCSSAVHEAFRAFVAHPVIQAVAQHFLRRLIGFPYASLDRVPLVELPVVPPYESVRVAAVQRLCVRMPGDAPRVRCVRLLYTVPDPGVLRHISSGPGDHARIQALQTVQERPAHDAHECGIAQSLCAACRFASRKCFCAGMDCLMAVLAQRNQIAIEII